MENANLRVPRLFYGDFKSVKRNVAKLCAAALSSGKWVLPQDQADWMDLSEAGGTIAIGKFSLLPIQSLYVNTLVEELQNQAARLAVAEKDEPKYSN